MKTFDLKAKALGSEKRETLLGFRETGSHACYMIYGVLKPGEKGRRVKPGPGHEEIVLSTRGDIEVTGYVSGTLREGSAFRLEGEHECCLENRGEQEAVYVIAGGHTEVGSHQT